MDSNISELVKLGHERADELKAACGAVDVRSVAQLISDLASQLEVQYVRAEESQREFRSADITMQNLEALLKQSKIKEAGNYPVIGIDLAAGPDRTVEVRYFAPPGYVMVPKCLTAENGAKSVMIGEFSETKFINCPECFGDDECETCDGSGRIEISVPVSWTNIKAIWAKGVEHFAAAPQQESE